MLSGIFKRCPECGKLNPFNAETDKKCISCHVKDAERQQQATDAQPGEPLPRGTTEWYAWAMAHPHCAVFNCTTAEAEWVDLGPLFGSIPLCAAHKSQAHSLLKLEQ